MLPEKDIIEIARAAVKMEAGVLNDLADSLGDAFEQCINAIYQSKGRLVLTGIGKSALVAQKISATLNSTGTPALFMHAADAVHGDMGMMQPDDLLICLSKSGESPEIRVLLPFVKNLGNTIIGMVSNKDSFLGKNADYILWTPVSREADPNNLAPTSSTTAQMAMGDALAVSLLALKGFTPKDFAKYHPGGALGKQLYLRVAELSEGNPQPAVREKSTIRQIIVEISSKRMGAAAVLDDNDRIVGVITDGDLRRMLEVDRDVSKETAIDIMTRNPKTIDHRAMAVDALSLMRNHSITQLLVEDDGRYCGMIHLHDLIREGLI